MQALILAGGEGTRLRPLTSTMPKPVVPLVGQPFISHMLEWLRRHGVDEAILSCGFMAEGIRSVLGDGSALGIALHYVEEPQPLGTGGALKFAEELLQERFFMLNGDVLTDIDLSAQLRQHERTGARATLALVPVEDPSAFGLVRCGADMAVSEFVEKPRPDEIDTNLINAGAYIVERDVLADMPPAGTRLSIERDVFPALVQRGLFGYEASGYWLDIGTPQRYLQATFDILEGDVSTEVGARLREAGGTLCEGQAGRVDGTVHAPALLGEGCVVSTGAILGGRTVLGHGVTVHSGAHIESSVLLDGCEVGKGTRISSAIVGPGVSIGEHCRLEGGVMLGQDVTVGADNVLAAGVRIFPGVHLPRWSDRVLTPPLTRAALAAGDPTGQLDDVLGLGEHLRDALWRVESANLAPHDAPGGLVIAGMGGSAIGGDLARAALGDRASRPIVIARDYGLAPWTTPDVTVLCVSYSGETEETLAAYDAAGALGARRIVCTTGGRLAQNARADGVAVIPLPGGFQPRAAVGYSFVVALEVAALAGVGARVHSEIDVAAAHCEQLIAEWGPDAPEDSPAKTLARALHNTVPQIAGAGLTAPVAYRWKCQINENAKSPSFAAELPELDHNEVVGWEGAGDRGPFSAVFLDDRDLHPRVRERMRLTCELVAETAVVTETIQSVGESRVERVVSTVLFGDLVSLYLAALGGVDPATIGPIDRLKAALSGADA